MSEVRGVDLYSILQTGLTVLKEDMQRCPSFDTTRPINEKNCYFEHANNLGLVFFWERRPWAAELYYVRLLKAIVEFENTSRKNFNKGMVYASLGIAQMQGNKFDDGIAHMLAAEHEDKDVNPNFRILDDEILWKPFEKRVLNYLLAFSSTPDITFVIDDALLDKLLKIMSVEDRIFLEGTLLALLHNLEIMYTTPNSYSLGQLYSALKDICLLVESLLRKSQISRSQMRKDEPRTLYNLLQKTLEGNSFNIDNSDNRTANSLDEFLNGLEQLAKMPDNIPVERYWLRYLILVRNFTGHHFDISNQTFFPALEQALQNVILALLYLKHIGAY